MAGSAYNSVETLLKMTGNLVPMLATAVTMTTATSEAMRAYSMAVTARDVYKRQAHVCGL